jgi:hypothetical protein
MTAVAVYGCVYAARHEWRRAGAPRDACAPGLKILLTSGYAAAVRDGALLEPFTVLAKPYRSDVLARASRAALDG